MNHAICVAGDAVENLFRGVDSLVYGELRRLAVCHLRREGDATALDPTDLVSEVYLRLATAPVEFADRAHFLAIASRGMRQILVDHARKRFATKRGSGATPVELDETHIATDRPRELVALDDALAALVRHDSRKARVTVLRYFGGLTHDEIAAMCGIHTNTVSRDLRDSEAWLRCHMECSAHSNSSALGHVDEPVAHDRNTRSICGNHRL